MEVSFKIYLGLSDYAKNCLQRYSTKYLFDLESNRTSIILADHMWRVTEGVPPMDLRDRYLRHQKTFGIHPKYVISMCVWVCV